MQVRSAHISVKCAQCGQWLCAAYMQLLMCWNACSCSCAGSIHAAYENLHTFCMHVFCIPDVLVCGIHVAHFNFCVCSTHEKRCLIMYAVYKPNMCSKVADIYTIKNGV